MRDKRVLITGGAGLVGSHIAELVAAQSPREIVVLDNFVRGRRENLQPADVLYPITIIAGDILDTKLLARVMKGIDIVFHQAAPPITQCAEDPRRAVDVLVNGTFNVLEAAALAKVRKVVTASSASVLDLAQQLPAPKSSLSDNTALFAAAKSFNEALLRNFSEMYGLRYVALRYGSIYGPRMDVQGLDADLLIAWMQSIEAGEPLNITGDGQQTFNLIDVRDVARACMLAATSDVSDEVLEVSAGGETSLNMLAEQLVSAMGASVQLPHASLFQDHSVSQHRVETGPTAERLGFTSQIDLMAGLRDLVEWWRHEQYSPLAQVASK